MTSQNRTTVPHKDLYLQVTQLRVLIRCPSKSIFSLLSEMWAPWVSSKVLPRCELVISARQAPHTKMHTLQVRCVNEGGVYFNTDNSAAALFVNKNNYEGVVYYAPWQKTRFICCGLIDPLLQTVLRRQGICLLHGAGVGNKNGSILILGASGSGKSTTASLLMANGYRLLSDDDILIALSGRAIAALGKESETCVHDQTLRLHPNLGSYSTKRYRKTASGIKRFLNLPKTGLKINPRVKLVLLPRVAPSSRSSVDHLAPRKALRRLLALPPNYYENYFEDRQSLTRLFSCLHQLTISTPCFTVTHGKSAAKLRVKLEELVK